MHKLLLKHINLNEEIALEAPNRISLTYHELNETIVSLKNTFKKLSINPLDPVAIVLPNGPDLGTLFLATACFGIAAPLNPNYSKKEFLFFLKDLRAKVLVVDPKLKSTASSAAKELGIPILKLFPNEKAGSFILKKNSDFLQNQTQNEPFESRPSLLLHTSGTTSKPKLVQLTAKNLVQSALNIGKTLQLSERDSCLNIMPLFHIHGLVAVLLASIFSNSRLICPPGFSALTFFGFLNKYRPTWYSGVPTMHQLILQRAKRNQDVINKNPLRFIRSSSAALPKPVLKELETTFQCPIVEAYGMTEASHQIASNPLPPKSRKAGTVGIAAGPQIKIIENNGNEMPANCVGEIVIKGNNVINCYANNPEANHSSFHEGWFRTGDLGSIDEDGYLTISGRIKEIINKGGEKISPKEIDDILQEMPAIEQVVCFAIGNNAYGEDIGCAIVLVPGMSLTEEEIVKHASKFLAKFKIPRRFFFLSEIPVGPTGKLQRIGLAKTLGLEDE